MGKRRHPRVDIRLPVRIFGTDVHGHPFSENVFTINIGAGGVLLDGVSSELKMDEIIGLTYGQKKNRFQIRWLPEKGNPSAGRVGLSSVPGQAPMWDTTFPVATEDGFFSKPVERRKHPRLKHAGSVELHMEGTAVVWGKTADISLGGCFVEMAIPLKKGTVLKIGLWVAEVKLWATARVVSSTPGYGIGLQFTEMSPKDAEPLQAFLAQIRPRF
ncbi:MAG: PilZ domain-containing protein [Acidobacteriaceae bacterium]